MRAVIIAGKPGSGKGTLLKRIESGIPGIFFPFSTGEELTKLPQDDPYHVLRAQGVQYEDGPMVELVKRRLKQYEASNAFHPLHRLLFFDGFPRNRAQLALAHESFDFKELYVLDVSDETALARSMKRRAECISLGLPVRSDDTEETVRERIGIYHRVTEPMLELAERLKIPVTVINGEQPIDAVARDAVPYVCAQVPRYLTFRS